VDEVIGRGVIIHGSPDDFTTQPSGNAGEKIACGVIRG
jgi:Cu-Zn family superoxide dismutase